MPFSRIREKLKLSLILPLNFIVIAPLTFYYNNIDEIEFTLCEVWLPVLILVSLSTLFLLILHLAIGRFQKLSAIVSGLLVGLALASWVQSQLFLWDFGPLTGNAIKWSNWSRHMWVEGFTWGLILVLCLYLFMSRKDKLSKAVVQMAYAVGLVSVLSTCILAPQKQDSPATSVDKSVETLFHLHPKNNVFIILLDTFQSDYFERISKEHPDETAALEGFTFYRNTMSRYPTTACALPSIMTGKLYENEIPYKDYLKKAYGSFSLGKYFASMHYSSEQVGPGPIVPGGLYMRNVINEYGMQFAPSWSFFIDYGLFKLSPTSLKRYIYNNGSWRVSFLMRKDGLPGKHGDDVRFLELFEKEAVVSDQNSKGVFRFFHFYIPHPRWYVDENLQYDQSLSGAAAYYRQTRGAMKLVTRMLEKIRTLGIYDVSEILILGDHGTQNLPPLSAEVSSNNLFAQIPLTVCSSSLALMLHKKPGAKGPLATDDAPLCTSDLRCLLGIEENSADCSEFNSAMQGAERRRRFLAYKWAHEFWKKDFMPAMTEYFVEGHAYDLSSWQKGNHRFEAQKKVPLAHETVKIGVPILFKADEPHNVFRHGWSAQEPEFRWTDGPVAGMELNVPDGGGKNLLLRLFGKGYAHSVIDLKVNDRHVATWQVDGDRWYEALIPSDVVGNGLLKVIFTIRNPTSPCEIGPSKDCRKLGIAAKEMVIEKG